MAFTESCATGSDWKSGAGICYNGPWTAPNTGDKRHHVRITHPFHPLRGKQFELIEHKCIYAESYLFFYDPFGRLLQIPAVWTDLLKPDAFVEAAVGRSPLHAGRLLELAELLKHLRKERSDNV
jgi:hypothetical protein